MSERARGSASGFLIPEFLRPAQDRERLDIPLLRGLGSAKHDWQITPRLSFKLDANATTDDLVYREYGDRLGDRARQYAETNVFVTPAVGFVQPHRQRAPGTRTSPRRSPPSCSGCRRSSSSACGSPSRGCRDSCTRRRRPSPTSTGSWAPAACEWTCTRAPSTPIPVAGLFTVTPFAGGRLTYYNERAVGTFFTNSGVTIEETTYDPHVRRQIEGGVETETRASRVFDMNGWGGLSALQHLIEPRATYLMIRGYDQKGNPQYDPVIDRIGRVTQIIYSLTNRVNAKTVAPADAEAVRWEAVRVALSQTYDIDRADLGPTALQGPAGGVHLRSQRHPALPRRRLLQYVRPGVPPGQRGPHGALPRRGGHAGVALQRDRRRQLGGRRGDGAHPRQSRRPREHQLGRGGGNAGGGPGGHSSGAFSAFPSWPTTSTAGTTRASSGSPSASSASVSSAPASGPGAVIPQIDLVRQHAALADELLAATARVLACSRFILGPEVAALESELAALGGARHGIGLNSGTDALLLALKAVGVGPGDEVITSAFSFVASASTVADDRRRARLRRHRPGDVQPRSARLEAAVTPRTRAVVPVHLYGQPAAMDEIEAIARRRGLAVVADAAQAVGASYDGRPIARVGRREHAVVLPDEEPRRLRRRRHGPHDARRRRGARAPPARPRLLEEVRARRARLLEPARRAPGGAPAREAPRTWPTGRTRAAASPRATASGLAGTGLGLPAERPPARHVYHQFAVRAPRRDALAAALADARRGHLRALPDHLAVPAALLPSRRRARLSPRGAGGDRDARPALLPGDHGSGDRPVVASCASRGGGRWWAGQRLDRSGEPWRPRSRARSSAPRGRRLAAPAAVGEEPLRLRRGHLLAEPLHARSSGRRSRPSPSSARSPARSTWSTTSPTWTRTGSTP